MVAAPHIQRGGTVPARKEGRLDGRFRLEIDDRRRAAVQRAVPLQRAVRHVHDLRCVAAHVEDRTRSLEEPASAVHLQRHARGNHEEVPRRIDEREAVQVKRHAARYLQPGGVHGAGLQHLHAPAVRTGGDGLGNRIETVRRGAVGGEDEGRMRLPDVRLLFRVDRVAAGKALGDGVFADLRIAVRQTVRHVEVEPSARRGNPRSDRTPGMPRLRHRIGAIRDRNRPLASRREEKGGLRTAVHQRDIEVSSPEQGRCLQRAVREHRRAGNRSGFRRKQHVGGFAPSVPHRHPRRARWRRKESPAPRTAQRMAVQVQGHRLVQGNRERRRAVLQQGDGAARHARRQRHVQRRAATHDAVHTRHGRDAPLVVVRRTDTIGTGHTLNLMCPLLHHIPWCQHGGGILVKTSTVDSEQIAQGHLIVVDLAGDHAPTKDAAAPDTARRKRHKTNPHLRTTIVLKFQRTAVPVCIENGVPVKDDI